MSGQRKKEYLVIRPASGPHPNPLPKGEGVFQQSYSFVQLITKEWRELFVSRSFWLLLLMIGPLVGHGFITAVNLYAEASGIGGGPSRTWRFRLAGTSALVLILGLAGFAANSLRTSWDLSENRQFFFARGRGDTSEHSAAADDQRSAVAGRSATRRSRTERAQQTPKSSAATRGSLCGLNCDRNV